MTEPINLEQVNKFIDDYAYYRLHEQEDTPQELIDLEDYLFTISNNVSDEKAYVLVKWLFLLVTGCLINNFADRDTAENFINRQLEGIKTELLIPFDRLSEENKKG